MTDLPRHRFRAAGRGVTEGAACAVPGCGRRRLDPVHIRDDESPVDETDADGTYIRTLLLKSGKYKVAVTVGDRVLVWLTQDRAVKYAAALARQIAAACIDAAVVAQLRDMDLPDQAVGVILKGMRDARTDPDPADTAPLLFQPGASLFTGKPFLNVRQDGRLSWQWDPAQARDHMAGVLESAAVAELDTAYRRLLIDVVDLDEGTAARMVADLGRFRDDSPPDPGVN